MDGDGGYQAIAQVMAKGYADKTETKGEACGRLRNLIKFNVV